PLLPRSGIIDGPATGDAPGREQIWTAGHGAWSSCWFSWVTPLMQTGSRRQLQSDDLLQLDPSLEPERCGRTLWLNWSKELLLHPQRPSLLRALARSYGGPFAWLGLVKLLNDLLSFSGPLLLRLLVSWLTATPSQQQHPQHPQQQPPSLAAAAAAMTSTAQGTHGSLPAAGQPSWGTLFDPTSGVVADNSSGSGSSSSSSSSGGWWLGWGCVVLLGLSSLARALLNAHFNYQLSRLSCQLRSGLMTALYRKSLLALRHQPPQQQEGAAGAGAAGAGGGAGTGAGTGARGAVKTQAGRKGQLRVQARARGKEEAAQPLLLPPPPAAEQHEGQGAQRQHSGDGGEKGGGGGDRGTSPDVETGVGSRDGVSPATATDGAAVADGGAPHRMAGDGDGDGDKTANDGGSTLTPSTPSPSPPTPSSPSSSPLGDVSTLMSVDAGRAVNLLLSFHELWSLPWQMGLALYLLYTQVHYAFLAGVLVSLLLVPLNRLLAARILTASTAMMAAKDARVRCMSELLAGVRGVKTDPAWLGFYVARVSSARHAELRGLAVRKYLDALCVFFWAATSLLFSALTFGLVVLLGERGGGGAGGGVLTPAAAFTSLALFQLLTGPLNAFPWVVNGVVEAMVSVRRLQAYLTRAETKALWAYEDLEMSLRDLPPASAAAVLHAATAAATAAAGGDGDGGGCDGAAIDLAPPPSALSRHPRCGLLAALHEAAADGDGGGGGLSYGRGPPGGGAHPLDRMLRALQPPPPPLPPLPPATTAVRPLPAWWWLRRRRASCDVTIARGGDGGDGGGGGGRFSRSSAPPVLLSGGAATAVEVLPASSSLQQQQRALPPVQSGVSLVALDADAPEAEVPLPPLPLPPLQRLPAPPP
ncbi:hypothetical protein Agub_g12778, partial [Astrephomene gubernaculifera]